MPREHSNRAPEDMAVDLSGLGAIRDTISGVCLHHVSCHIHDCLPTMTHAYNLFSPCRPWPCPFVPCAPAHVFLVARPRHSSSLPVSTPHRSPHVHTSPTHSHNRHSQSHASMTGTFRSAYTLTQRRDKKEYCISEAFRTLQFRNFQHETLHFWYPPIRIQTILSVVKHLIQEQQSAVEVLHAVRTGGTGTFSLTHV